MASRSEPGWMKFIFGRVLVEEILIGNGALKQKE